MAGAVIGAAASSARRSRQAQPQVVIVQQSPGGSYPQQQQYMYQQQPGGGYATYQQPGGQQQQYIVTQQQQQQQQQAGKRQMNRGKGVGCLVCCCFMLAIIICMAAVAWPGEVRHDIIPGSQNLMSFSGLFTDSVMVDCNQGCSLQTTAYMFHSSPALSNTRYYSNSLNFPLAPYEFTSIRFDLFDGSTMDINWVYAGCTLQFLVYNGAAKYNTFVAGGNPTPYYRLSFNTVQRVMLNIVGSDSYYFVFDNPSLGCYPTPTTAIFAVSAKSYDTSSAFLTCSASNCSVSTEYGSTLYMVLEPPTSTPQATYISIYTTAHGRWYAYVGLYVGLFLGMLLCTAIAVKLAAKKEARDYSINTAAEEEQGLLASSAPAGTSQTLPPSAYAPQPYPPEASPISPKPYPQQPPASGYYSGGRGSFNSQVSQPGFVQLPVQPTAPSQALADQPPPYTQQEYSGTPEPQQAQPPPPQVQPGMRFDPSTGLPL